jgi:Amidase
MLSEDILFLSVTDLSKRIRSRQLSPVELTESYLERGRTVGKKLNAYATLTPDLALKQAHAAEKEIAAGHYRGPLHGIPYAANDLLAVKGYPAGWGARPYSDQRLDHDAMVIKKLEAAGAVLLGKAAMIELERGASNARSRSRMEPAQQDGARPFYQPGGLRGAPQQQARPHRPARPRGLQRDGQLLPRTGNAVLWIRRGDANWDRGWPSAGIDARA